MVPTYIDPTTTIGAPRSAPDDIAAARTRRAVPEKLAARLRPLAENLVEEVLREIQRAVPAYAEPLRGRSRDTLVGAITVAVHQCLEPASGTVDWKAAFRHLGKVEFAEGRSTDPMQTAIRVGARVLWRQINLAGHAIDIPSDIMLLAAEAGFGWVDTLSAMAIEGYQDARARAQIVALDVQEQSRRHLTRAILSNEPAAKKWINSLAEAAGWPLPERLVPIAVEPRGDHDELADLGHWRNALVNAEGSIPCVLLPDPGRDREPVTRSLGGRRAAIGPAVALAEVTRSLTLARRMLGLMQTTSASAPHTRITWCQDHLATLLLLADPFLTTQLREHTEIAFAGLTPRQRDRLATTLLAWLQSRGTHTEIAAQLDVHPQTVRYRIHQLQQLLGDRLADPDARLTLELALRAHMLLTPGAPDGPRY